MAATTQANVLRIAPELSTVDQDLWDLILADVDNIVSFSIFGIFTEVAARYLVAHELTILQPGTAGSNSSGPVIEEKVGDVTYKYMNTTVKVNTSDSDYFRTKYGRTFVSYRNKCIANFRVIPPGY